MPSPYDQYTDEQIGQAQKKAKPGVYDAYPDAKVGAAVRMAKTQGSAPSAAQSPQVQPRVQPETQMPSTDVLKGRVANLQALQEAHQYDTAKDIGSMATGMIPLVGAGIGAMAAAPATGGASILVPVLGAGVGAAGGEALRRLVNVSVGIENPNEFQPGSIAKGMAVEGAKNMLFEGAGRFLIGPLAKATVAGAQKAAPEWMAKNLPSLSRVEVATELMPEKLIKKAMSPAAQEVKAAEARMMARAGKPGEHYTTISETTGDPFLTTAQGIRARSIFGKSQETARMNNIRAGAEDSLNKTMDTIVAPSVGKTDPMAVLSMAQKNLQPTLNALVKPHYDEIDQRIGQEVISLAPIAQEMKTINSQWSGLREMLPSIYKGKAEAEQIVSEFGEAAAAGSAPAIPSIGTPANANEAISALLRDPSVQEQLRGMSKKEMGEYLDKLSAAVFNPPKQITWAEGRKLREDMLDAIRDHPDSHTTNLLRRSVDKLHQELVDVGKAKDPGAIELWESVNGIVKKTKELMDANTIKAIMQKDPSQMHTLIQPNHPEAPMQLRQMLDMVRETGTGHSAAETAVIRAQAAQGWRYVERQKATDLINGSKGDIDIQGLGDRLKQFGDKTLNETFVTPEGKNMLAAMRDVATAVKNVRFKPEGQTLQEIGFINSTFRRVAEGALFRVSAVGDIAGSIASNFTGAVMQAAMGKAINSPALAKELAMGIRALPTNYGKAAGHIERAMVGAYEALKRERAQSPNQPPIR